MNVTEKLSGWRLEGTRQAVSPASQRRLLEASFATVQTKASRHDDC
jgi:hypothetical protein